MGVGQFLSRLHRNLRRGYQSRPPGKRGAQLLVGRLEDRTLLSAITWANENNSNNGFSALGANEGNARAEVRQAMLDWQNVIFDLNQPGGGNTISINVSIQGSGRGGATNTTALNQGFPTAANITLGGGDDGHGAGYFFDPTPWDSSEFEGSLANDFSSYAPNTSPAYNKTDFYTIILHELGHAIGFTGSNSLYQSSPYNHETTAPNSPAYFWVFQGPSVTHLMTSNNGGTSDPGVPIHSAWTDGNVNWGNTTLHGVEDLMNAGSGPSERRLIPSYLALVLHDAYGYDVQQPAFMPTMFMLEDNAGNLLIRGGAGASSDTITLSQDPTFPSFMIATVAIGTPVQGVDPSPVYSQEFYGPALRSIHIQPGQGADTITVHYAPAGMPINIDLDNVPGPLTITGSGATSLAINDASDSMVLTNYSLASSGLTRTGTDVFGLQHNASITYSGLASLVLNTAALSNTVFVESTSVPTTVDASAGNFLVAVSSQAEKLDNLPAPLTVNGGGGTQLFVNDQNNPNPIPTQYSLTSTNVTRTAVDVFGRVHTASITYSSLASLALNTATLSNMVFVESTMVPTTVDAGAGNVLVVVSGQAGNLDNLPASLTVNGGGGTQLIIDDHADPNPIFTTYSLTSTNLARNGIDVFGQQHPASITYSGLASLTLNTGALASEVFVESAAAPTTVNAGAGNFLTVVSSQAGNLDNLPASLTVNGGGGTQLVIDDHADPNPILTTYSLTGTNVARNGIDPFGRQHPASTTYSGLASLVLDTGALSSEVFVESTAVPTTVNAGAGNFLAVVSSQAGNLDNLPAPLTINGGGGTQLVIDDHADPNPILTTYSLTSTNVARNGIDVFGQQHPASITYGGLASLTLNTGALASEVFVESTAAPTTVNAGAGNFLAVVSSQAGNLDNLPAPLTINGGGGTQLIINDQANAAIKTYTVTATTVTRAGFGGLTYANVGSLVLNGSTKADTYNIQSTNGATPVTINGGVASDTFNVGSSTGSSSTLNAITGNLTVNGNGGTDVLNARDGGQSAGQSYTVSATTVSGSTFTGIITYAVEKLLLTLGTGNDNVTATAVPTGVTVNGGAGTNTLTGPDLTNTWTINNANAGYLSAATKLAFSNFQNLVGGTGNDTFKFSGAAPSLTGTLNGGGGTLNKLDYSDYTGGAIAVMLPQAGSDSATLIGGGFSALQSFVGSPNTGDALAGTNATTAWAATALNGGKAGTFAFTGIENLHGGTGADTFKISNGKGVSGSITSGGGADVLDYSLWTTPVTVNLQTGSATGVGGTATSFHILNGGTVNDSLTGTTGNDIIRGNGGDDLIQGNGGNDILIGGTGNDTLSVPLSSSASILIGSQGADHLTGSTLGCILIGGYTSYDSYSAANDTALPSILNEWASPVDNYTTRIAKIRAGVGTGKFASTTVHDDAITDVLTGQVNFSTGNRDWFWAGLGTNPDSTNAESGEQIN